MGIQSLRGFAALLVVLCHLTVWQKKYFAPSISLPSWLASGEFGLDLFFVISGFIIMYVTPRPLLNLREQGIFLFRRLTRIYPAFWAVAILLVIAWLIHPTILNDKSGNKVNIVSSLLLLPQHISNVLVVAWTLTFELYFYLIASTIFYLNGRKRIGAILFWLTALILINALHPLPFTNPYLRLASALYSVEFIGGMFIAWFIQNSSFRLHKGLAIAGSLGTLIYVFAMGSTHHVSDLRIRLVCYGIPALVLVWIVLQMEIQGKWSWMKKLAPVGNRSYSLYLVHVPFIVALYRLIAAKLHVTHAFELQAMAVIITLGLVVPTELCYRFVEYPSHQFAKQFSWRRKSPSELPAAAWKEAKPTLSS